MLERPQQPALSSRTFQPADSSSSIAARPIAGSVKVVNESARKTTSPLAPRARLALLVPAQERLAGEARERPAAVDARHALEQPARDRQVGERRGGGAEPVELADRAEQLRAERRAVLGLVVREELRLHRRHVDAQRALALARLALEAEVEDLVQPLVAQRGARIGLRQRLDERVGAPAGGVLLLAGGHVGRAHHALAGLAAGADPLAAVGGGAHPALAEGEVRLQRQRGRERRVAEVGGERRGVDHHARVEAPVGVEQRLDLAHRRVEVLAEHARVERAAHAPVAVLGGVDAVELRHQRGDLVGDGGHRVDAARVVRGRRTGGRAGSRRCSARRSRRPARGARGSRGTP